MAMGDALGEQIKRRGVDVEGGHARTRYQSGGRLAGGPSYRIAVSRRFRQE